MELSGPTTPSGARIANVSFQELLNQISVEPITVPVAVCAGRIDGWLQAKGIRVALGDPLIGATALELGISVATHNIRHFEKIPSLQVVSL